MHGSEGGEGPNPSRPLSLTIDLLFFVKLPLVDMLSVSPKRPIGFYGDRLLLEIRNLGRD